MFVVAASVGAQIAGCHNKKGQSSSVSSFGREGSKDSKK